MQQLEFNFIRYELIWTDEYRWAHTGYGIPIDEIVCVQQMTEPSKLLGDISKFKLSWNN